jgi:hypothetical protein
VAEDVNEEIAMFYVLEESKSSKANIYTYVDNMYIASYTRKTRL